MYATKHIRIKLPSWKRNGIQFDFVRISFPRQDCGTDVAGNVMALGEGQANTGNMYQIKPILIPSNTLLCHGIFGVATYIYSV